MFGTESAAPRSGRPKALSGDTGGVTLTPHDWSDQVRESALAGDRLALGRLYAEAQVIFGAQASQKWAELLSAYDAGAETG